MMMELQLEKPRYSMRDLVVEIGMSPPWIRRMEKMELIKPAFPKVRGREGRQYSHGDVINMLRLMALTTVGYPPQDVKHYADLVSRFNKLTEPFLNKPRILLDSSAVILFDLRDIFPDGDPENIAWSNIEKAITREDGIYKFYKKEIDPGELLGEVLQLLYSIGEKAQDASMAIKKTRRALRLAGSIEKDIDESFLPGVKKPFFSPGDFGIGIPGQGVAFQLRELFRIKEERETKAAPSRVKKA